jgi:hypothetical protein
MGSRVIPAAIAEGEITREHGEPIMHGAPPSAPHAQHLVVAIFNSPTGERVTDAVVTAQVSVLGVTSFPRRCCIR